MDNFDDRYNYYFYGFDGLLDINMSFLNGLIIDNDYGRYKEVTSKVSMHGLYEYLREYANENNYNTIFVIKIPAYYLGWVHRNGKIEPFVPILVSKKNQNCDEKTIITSNLVYGVYDNNCSVYLSNDNYNPLYDPSGMKYVDLQLHNMYKYGCYDLYMREMRRDNFSYDELKKMDDENGRWSRVLKHYSKNSLKRVLKKIFK